MRPRTLERLDVIAVPAFVAHLQYVRATHMRQNIAPVVVVLNEIALRETQAVAEVLSGYADDRNGEVAGLVQLALNAIPVKHYIIQGRRIEGVRPVHLEGALPAIVRGIKLRDGGR